MRQYNPNKNYFAVCPHVVWPSGDQLWYIQVATKSSVFMLHHEKTDKIKQTGDITLAYAKGLWKRHRDRFIEVFMYGPGDPIWLN